jgi:hypothetical protein
MGKAECRPPRADSGVPPALLTGFPRYRLHLAVRIQLAGPSATEMAPEKVEA